MKPRIYLHVYPSGFKFWRVQRRGAKKHSRWRPEERDNLAAAYAYCARMNKVLDEEARLKLIANSL